MAIDTQLINDDVQYRVTLNQKIVLTGEMTLYPGWAIELRGDVVKQHAEAIDHAEAV